MAVCLGPGFGGHYPPGRTSWRRCDCLDCCTVEPFLVAPWAEESLVPRTATAAAIAAGRFFLRTVWRQQGSVARRAASAPRRDSQLDVAFRISPAIVTTSRPRFDFRSRPRSGRGRVDKLIRPAQGETAVYCQHVVSKMSGQMNLGHHATLKFPDEPGSGVISTSPMSSARVLPVTFEEPVKRGYSSLKKGRAFLAPRSRPGTMDGTDGRPEPLPGAAWL